jgi:hypothetical protein
MRTTDHSVKFGLRSELICTYVASTWDLPEVRQFRNSALTIPEGEDDEYRQASLKVKEHGIHQILVGCSRSNFRFRVLTEFELAKPTWDTGQNYYPRASILA